MTLVVEEDLSVSVHKAKKAQLSSRSITRKMGMHVPLLMSLPLILINQVVLMSLRKGLDSGAKARSTAGLFHFLC